MNRLCDQALGGGLYLLGGRVVCPGVGCGLAVLVVGVQCVGDLANQVCQSDPGHLFHLSPVLSGHTAVQAG